MRNEMFKEPLTSAEIKSCIASHGETVDGSPTNHKDKDSAQAPRRTG